MSLEVRGLTKLFGGRPVVDDVSFKVDAGELIALLGPSGSGKTTILRAVAGLTLADAGTVLVEGKDVTGLPPQTRDLGFVFQNYALFEHLTVADNVEFALRVRRVDRRQRQTRRDELLELVGLGGSGRKYPSQLSGGQRQRAALARALAHRPRMLLLDEPFGALDARIRQELRQGLRELLKKLGTTAVFVTHDQEEAFAVADRIMVLHRGRLLEEGPPQQLYVEPRTEFVAGFIGRANLLPGELTSQGVRVRLGNGRASADAIPRRVKVLLRPEKLIVLRGDAPVPAEWDVFSHAAEVERVEFLGSSERVHVRLEAAGGRRHHLESLRNIETARMLPLRPGDRVTLFADQMHAISQPSFRLLALATDDAEGHALVRSALAYGERQHALVTVLGAAVGDPELHAPLEKYRQSFAGDLRLIDTRASGIDLWEAARTHLAGESYDLILLPASMRSPDRLYGLLRTVDARQFWLAAAGDDPLAAGPNTRWLALLRAFSASQPNISLLAEMVEELKASVEVRDLQGTAHPAEPPPRWHDAFALRSIPFTVDHAADEASKHDPFAYIGTSAEVIAIDLGPRAGLDARQRAWLQALDGRAALLMVQPNAIDLSLRPRTDLYGEAVQSEATRSVGIQSNSTQSNSTHSDDVPDPLRLEVVQSDAMRSDTKQSDTKQSDIKPSLAPPVLSSLRSH
jgi:sulfate transport system ATP-binding protein